MTTLQDNKTKATPTISSPPIELRKLTVRAGGHVLLREVDARIAPGKVTLIVGRSGVGKSVLLKALSGLNDEESDIHVTGQVLIDDRVVNGRADRSGVGVVFQSFALLDELSPLENVAFAADHRRSKGTRRSPAELLQELDVPARSKVSVLSGGQKQRLAIARTLAYGPEVLLYDEPTSGLDIATGRRVAKLISETHEHHHKTSVIVTHDYLALMPIADEILLLDPDLQTLRTIPREQWNDLEQLLAAAVPSEDDPIPLPQTSALTSSVSGFLAGTSDACLQMAALPLRLLPLWRSPYWAMRYLMHYLWLIVGPSAWLYLGVSGFLTGFVATYFTFRFLPYAQYTEALILEDVLQAVGYLLGRVLIPVLATILIAARCGAAVTSDVAAKSYGQQLSAMRSLGARPTRYLATPILYSFLIGVPVLTAFTYAAAAVASMLVFNALHPQLGFEYWTLHFNQLLFSPEHVMFIGWEWMAGKLLTCAAGVATISYFLGATPKDSSRSVSRSITQTVLWSTLFVLAVHFGIALFEF
ncbi:MAG: ABC-type multidrug transport system ATPase subunit [Pirellulaceae bacterium]|jgi:ABC-type multidrug transport system ATPase subunit/ABC-type transporter Mla maintaining outer membrane lipid asymmetry permease subunit MlaE